MDPSQAPRCDATAPVEVGQIIHLRMAHDDVSHLIVAREIGWLKAVQLNVLDCCGLRHAICNKLHLLTPDVLDSEGLGEFEHGNSVLEALVTAAISLLAGGAGRHRISSGYVVVPTQLIWDNWRNGTRIMLVAQMENQPLSADVLISRLAVLERADRTPVRP